MAKQSKAHPSPPAVPIPPGMIRASVSRFDDRRGTGTAITCTGRKVRIPLCVLNDAKIVALSVGDVLFVELDPQDRGRVQAILLPDGS